MYFNHKLFIIIGLMLAILFFSNCEEKEPHYYYISQEIKEYGDFKVGSYWIYEADSSDVEDSIWVVNYSIGQNEEVIDKKVLSVFEKITIECESNRNIDYIIEMDVEKMFTHLGFVDIDKNYNIRYGMSYYYKDLFTPHPGSGDSLIVYDTFNLLGNTYDNVLYRKAYNPILNLDDYSKEYDTLEYWIAKDVGVIKKITRNKYENHTYCLKRYYTIQ